MYIPTKRKPFSLIHKVFSSRLLEILSQNIQCTQVRMYIHTWDIRTVYKVYTYKDCIQGIRTYIRTVYKVYTVNPKIKAVPLLK